MSKKRVALVEDNADNRLLVEAILEGEFEVVSFTSGLAALEAFAHNCPDLVLLDISLPEMDGPEVLLNIRGQERWGEVPVIALTAHAMAGDREKFLAMGFNDYVSKPIVDENVLLGAIHRLLA